MRAPAILGVQNSGSFGLGGEVLGGLRVPSCLAQIRLGLAVVQYMVQTAFGAPYFSPPHLHYDLAGEPFSVLVPACTFVFRVLF